MNQHHSNIRDEITLHVSGQVTLSRAALEAVISGLLKTSLPVQPAAPPPAPVAPTNAESKKEKRLAYTMRETAAILGLSYATVHRLLQRGLLKSSKAVRRKIIPAAEIERFLKETL